jgi:tetratricopeptide (TPR) repeat protein
MKQYILIALLMILSLFSFSQADKVKALTDEGVALHDKADYENALKKFDEAIALDAASINALYEKTYTLYAMKRLDECVELSKQLVKQFPGNELLKAVYVQYGSSLDDLGRPDEAIKIYNQGLKKFPGYHLLNYNKGITYSLLNEPEKAYACFQDALTANPLHSSSYLHVSQMLKSSNHIPAMMACIMFLITEPDSDRSPPVFKALNELMYGNVKKSGEKAVTITLSPDMFDTKKTKKEPDNFRSQEMLFSLSSALDKDSVMSSLTKTDIDKFDLKLQLLINGLTENQKGFFSERYVPFFKKLKENNFTMAASRLVFSSTKDDRNDLWMRANAEKIAEFYTWLKAYRWPEK